MKKFIITTALSMLCSIVSVMAQDSQEGILQKRIDSTVDAKVQCLEKKLGKKLTTEASTLKTGLSKLQSIVENNKTEAEEALDDKATRLQGTINNHTEKLNIVTDKLLLLDSSAVALDSNNVDIGGAVTKLWHSNASKTDNSTFYKASGVMGLFILIALIAAFTKVRRAKREQTEYTHNQREENSHSSARPGHL